MRSKPPAAEPGEKVTEYSGPVARYEVIETTPTAPEDRFIAAEMYAPEEGAELEEVAEVEVEAPAVPVPEMPAEAAPAAKPKKPLDRKRLLIFGGTGAGFVLVLLLVWWLCGRSEESIELSPVNDGTTGLTGHLLSEWNGRLSYKLALEPGDPSLLPHFRHAVYSSSQPLAFEIQIKDPLGAVLCRTMVLLRFDPLKNVVPVTAPAGKKMTADEMNRAQAEQALNNARLESQELARENGNPMFSNVNGPDGQVESLSAQGTLPCTRKQYDHAASWGFTTNYPPPGTDDNTAPARNVQPVIAAGGRKRKPTAPVSHFSIEEDDVAVSYQASSGALETRNGRRLLVERKDALAATLKNADLPLRIHFRCNQFGACTLAIGGSVQRASLQR